MLNTVSGYKCSCLNVFKVGYITLNFKISNAKKPHVVSGFYTQQCRLY